MGNLGNLNFLLKIKYNINTRFKSRTLRNGEHIRYFFDRIILEEDLIQFKLRNVNMTFSPKAIVIKAFQKTNTLFIQLEWQFFVCANVKII